jgi:hypothetical protein
VAPCKAAWLLARALSRRQFWRGVKLLRAAAHTGWGALLSVGGARQAVANGAAMRALAVAEVLPVLLPLLRHLLAGCAAPHPATAAAAAECAERRSELLRMLEATAEALPRAPTPQQRGGARPAAEPQCIALRAMGAQLAQLLQEQPAAAGQHDVFAAEAMRARIFCSQFTF